MGYYVNPRNETKEAFLRREGIFAPLLPKTTWESVPKGFLPVTLANNGAFTAANICFCKEELEAMTYLDDTRPRQVFMVKIEKLIPVADEGFKQYAIKQGWIPAPSKRTTKERITIKMSMREIVEVMAEEIPGIQVLNNEMVLTEILTYGPQIDPDSPLGGLGSIMTLDSLGIYGDKIRLLYEMCDHNIMKIIAIIRAYQLGQLESVTKEKLMHAIENKGEGIDLDATIIAVKARLPRFNSKFKIPGKKNHGSVISI